MKDYTTGRRRLEAVLTVFEEMQMASCEKVGEDKAGSFKQTLRRVYISNCLPGPPLLLLRSWPTALSNSTNFNKTKCLCVHEQVVVPKNYS